MITLKNSSVNGWYFESFENGEGEGKCVKCGHQKYIVTHIMSFPKCKCESQDKELGSE